MGQARQRGTYDQRRAEGIAKREERERLAELERSERAARWESVKRERARLAQKLKSGPGSGRPHVKAGLSMAIALSAMSTMAITNDEGM